MKYKGEQLKAPISEIIAFTLRSEIVEGRLVYHDLVFEATAILDFSEFLAICPEPSPPPRILAGGQKDFDFESPTYKKAREIWFSKRNDWTVLKSVENSPDIEWEKIKMNDPETWPLWRDEIGLFLNPTQIMHLWNRIMLLNSIDEAKMEEARQRFLVTKSQRVRDATSLRDEPTTTQSGVPASV